MPAEYIFCPYCRSELQPFSDGERLRSYCPNCDWIHYRNPTVGVAVILLQEASSSGGLPELLLGERRDGGWCIPCGHVEWDEEVESAAKREFLEETGLEVDLDGVYAVQSNFHNPKQHTVGIWYRGKLSSGDVLPGGDLIKVRFFSLDDLPEIKFPTDRVVIAKLISNFD